MTARPARASRAGKAGKVPPLTIHIGSQASRKQHGLKLCLVSSLEREVHGLVDSLLTQLKEEDNETSDEAKVKAIYTWVATNISYDVASYRRGRMLDPRHDAGMCAYHTRRALCSGYADLFYKMCSHAGIECARIQGFAKGGDYLPGDVVDGQTNHEWNAVRLAGTWRIVDATWGAGHMTSAAEGEWVKDYSTYFLFPPPDQLVHTHLPGNQRWQLLARHVSTLQFEQEAHYHAGFFRHDIIACNQPMGVLDGNMDAMTVQLSAFRPMLYTYSFCDPRRGKTFNRCVSYAYRGASVRFRIRLPYWAAFHFTVHGKVVGSRGHPTALVSYTILSSDVSGLVADMSAGGGDLLWGVTPQYDYLRLQPPSRYSTSILTSSQNQDVAFAMIEATAGRSLDFTASLTCLGCDCQCQSLSDRLTLTTNTTQCLPHLTELPPPTTDSSSSSGSTDEGMNSEESSKVDSQIVQTSTPESNKDMDNSTTCKDTTDINLILNEDCDIALPSTELESENANCDKQGDSSASSEPKCELSTSESSPDASNSQTPKAESPSQTVFTYSVHFPHQGEFVLSIYARCNSNDPFLCISKHKLCYV